MGYVSRRIACIKSDEYNLNIQFIRILNKLKVFSIISELACVTIEVSFIYLFPHTGGKFISSS